MAERLPLHSKLGQLVIGQQPRMAFSATHSSTRGQTGGGSRQTWIRTDRGRKIILGEVETLIRSRLPNIKSAFRVVDHDGTGLVSKEEFRQVLKNLLSLNQNQLNEVCEGSGATVDYMQFLKRYSRTPVAQRPSSSHSSVRIGPQNTSMSLSEIQNHLKHKIGGNLRTVIRVFRLFDHNREGNIQQHEFRHILDNYCIHLTDKEFRRLWHHYCPSNAATISYELFLDKLGFGDNHNFRIAPVCTKLAVSGRGTTPFERVDQKKQRAESQSSSCDTPSHRNLHTLFYDKMCMNSTPVWQALQAFDTTCSGWVKRDVLRVVLSSFIFPMNPHSFQKLTSRYGVRTTGPVRWKHFLGRFMNPVKEEGDTKLPTDRSGEHPAPDENNLNFQDIYPQLKEIFSLLDMKEAGGITRADLRRLLERPGATQHRIPSPQLQQITELFGVLDSENTGVVPLASLERLNPNKTSAPTCNTSPPAPPSPTNTTDHLENPEETKGTTTKSEEQKTPDESETTQWADKVSVASASQRTVESLLLDKLCEKLSSVLEELKLCDPQHTGYITQEDLKRILSCYGMPISDTHFNKLCKPCNSRPGRSSSLVCYNGFFSNLGIPLTQRRSTSLSHEDSDHTESPCTSPQSTLLSIRGQRPPSSMQVGQETNNIMDTVFQRMRSRLEQRHTSLTNCIQAIIHNSEAVDLSETDLRKILEDSRVILDDENFSKFTEQLGFMDGRIERSVFQAKYEEATARAAGQQASEGGDGDNPLLTSAEQCLAALKTKIKIIHGNNLTAFRLMDRKCKGVVDCRDFRVLYNSLGFFCSEEEYERLLDLIGLHPGGNLNYAEFVDIVENNGRQRARQEQLHELLAHEARYKWADMSKVLCQSDADNQGRIDKKSLRGLLFTYALPMNSNEFDRLWSRYDPEGRGSVAVCDFLEKLGCNHEGVVRSQSQKLRKTVVHSDTASLERIQQILQENYNELSNALTHLETRDGTVTVAELLSLLHNFSCPIQREQLVHHLHRFKVSMDDNCKRLSYMDFLSTFDHKGEMCEPPPSSPDAVHQIESLDDLSPDMALSRMRELVTASAPNLYKAFSAFDQSRTGMVRAVDFRQVLESFCARSSDKQYRYLLTKLELNCDTSTVNWKDFLNKFLSHSPPVSDRALRGSRERGAKSRPSAQTETSGITKFPQQVQEMVSGHLNPSNSNTMSKEQFRQLCDRHCLSLTNDQFVCVWRQMPVTEQRKLQYREHMKGSGKLDRTLHTTAEGPSNNMSSPSPEPRETATATKPCCPSCAGAIVQRTKSAPQCISGRPASVGRPATGCPSGSMERKLRGGVQRCWKEIQKKCAEEDPQRDGHIATASFLEILQSLDISITEEQFENLAAKFDIINNGCVSYHTFFHHFLLNLKPAETTREFERRRLPLPTTQTSQGVLSKDCVEVMLRTYNVVCSSWTAIRRSFLASDRTRTGSVSVQDFRKVLCHFGVNLSEEDFFQLCSYFDVNTTGKICYNNFLWAFLH